MGKPREDILSSAKAEIGQAQQMIEVKNNEIQKHMEDAQWLEESGGKTETKSGCAGRTAGSDRPG